jgi:glycerol kinase
MQAGHTPARSEFRQIFPQPGWVEHDAGEIWASQEGVLQQVLRDSGVAASDVAAIGVTNQRETTVLWDRATGVPVANAIVWQDRRNAAFCEQLVEQGKADVIQRKTGLVLDAYFPPPSSNGCSTTWTAPARAERGELAFGTVDSWLIYKMSGAHITDTSNAARTMLFNIHTLQWDTDLLALLDIPASCCPTSCRPAAWRPAHAALLGVSVPIAGIAGDQQAATFGQACLKPGMAKNTYGTGCFMLMNVGKRPLPSKPAADDRGLEPGC